MWFNTRNVTAQTATTREPRCSASPISIVTTAVIIGLRTYWYGPTATRRRVGSHGASVPWPTRAKSETHQVNSASPQRKITIPAPWAEAAATVPPIQRVSHTDHARNIQRGTITTITNGRIRIATRWRRRVMVSRNAYGLFGAAGWRSLPKGSPESASVWSAHIHCPSRFTQAEESAASIVTDFPSTVNNSLTL